MLKNNNSNAKNIIINFREKTKYIPIYDGHIDLPWKNLGEEGFNALATVLKTDSTITHVNLAHNYTSNRELKILAEALETNITVTHINFVHDATINELHRILIRLYSSEKLDLRRQQRLAFELLITEAEVTLFLLEDIKSKLTANINHGKRFDYIKFIIEEIVRDEEIDLSLLGSSFKILSSISSEDYEYMMARKNSINSLIIREIEEYKAAISLESFWQKLEAFQSTFSVEQDIFSLLGIPRRNAITSILYSYAKEGQQLYELFAAHSQSEVGDDITAPEGTQKNSDLTKFQKRYATVTEDNDITILWEDFITYASKILDWSVDKMADLKVLKAITVNRSTEAGKEQYLTMEELKKAVLFHSLYPQYKDISLVIKDYSEEIIEGLKRSDANIETRNLITSLTIMMISNKVREDTKIVIDKILISVYENGPELFVSPECTTQDEISQGVATLYSELETHEKDLKVRQGAYGDIHPDIAASLDSIGTSHEKLGNPKKALEFRKKALQMRQELYGDIHPDVAASLDSIGKSYEKMSDVDNALKYFKQALKTYRKVSYSGDHPNVSALLNSISNAYQELENRAEEEKIAVGKILSSTYEDEPELFKLTEYIEIPIVQAQESKEQLTSKELLGTLEHSQDKKEVVRNILNPYDNQEASNSALLSVDENSNHPVLLSGISND